jgi:hypothetical protein
MSRYQDKEKKRRKVGGREVLYRPNQFTIPDHVRHLLNTSNYNRNPCNPYDDDPAILYPTTTRETMTMRMTTRLMRKSKTKKNWYKMKSLMGRVKMARMGGYGTIGG